MTTSSRETLRTCFLILEVDVLPVLQGFFPYLFLPFISLRIPWEEPSNRGNFTFAVTERFTEGGDAGRGKASHHTYFQQTPMRCAAPFGADDLRAFAMCGGGMKQVKVQMRLQPSLLALCL
jgi:hypothetical protein